MEDEKRLPRRFIWYEEDIEIIEEGEGGEDEVGDSVLS